MRLTKSLFSDKCLATTRTDPQLKFAYPVTYDFIEAKLVGMPALSARKLTDAYASESRQKGTAEGRNLAAP